MSISKARAYPILEDIFPPRQTPEDADPRLRTGAGVRFDRRGLKHTAAKLAVDKEKKK